MDNTVKELNEIVMTYGPERVKAAIEEILGKISKPIPVDHVPVISPDKLSDTIAQLDAAASDVLEAGRANEAAYKDKAELLKRKTQLETEIQLVEAEAVMQIKGEARNQYVEIGGVKTALTNDQARDAYRRMSSRPAREELAKIEAQIPAIYAFPMLYSSLLPSTFSSFSSCLLNCPL
jgi:hypothetical protein